jgi:hypothetical protein
MTAAMRSALMVVVLGLGLVAGCKRSHEDAVKVTKERCGAFLAAHEAKAGCDELAKLTVSVSDPFGDMSNDKELGPADDEYLTKCMDAIAEDWTERCKDNSDYKKAMDKIFYAVMK